MLLLQLFPSLLLNHVFIVLFWLTPDDFIQLTSKSDLGCLLEGMG